MHIIIRGKSKFGKIRSEQEENMRKEWGQTMSDEHLDKLKYIEKKLKTKNGTAPSFVRQTDIDRVK